MARGNQGSFDETPGRVSLRMLLVIGALTAFGPLSIDSYLPALPASAPHWTPTRPRCNCP
jgi:hypothetical protein